MTTSTRLERNLPGILDDLSAAPTSEYLDDVFARTARMRQRPAWTFPERWLPMADIASRPAFAPRLPWRTIGVALVILALLIGAAVAYVGSHQTRLPAPFGPAANGLIPYVTNGDIYVGDPVTGTTRLLVGGPEDDFSPKYSRDGTHVALAREVKTAALTPALGLYVARDDGSDLHRVTPEPFPIGQWFAWTPDGRIAVIQKVLTTGCAVTICFTNQLDLFDATGSGSVEHIAAAAGMDFAQFRPPDGHEILYRALVDGNWGLFVMDADGTNVRTLVQPTVPEGIGLAFAGTVYSTDGSKIFYQYADATGCCRLWVMNADGTDQHEFLPLGPAWDGEAVASPDGTRIAYWHHANDGPPAHGISVVRADGTGSVIETGPKLPGTAHWVWAPDSSKILLYPDDASSSSAYLLDPEGGPWTTVPWASDADLDWQRLAP
jgi:hypothetical protein